MSWYHSSANWFAKAGHPDGKRKTRSLDKGISAIAILTPLTVAPTKACRLCGAEKVIDAFRLLRRDGPWRASECNRCHSKAEVLRVKRKRASRRARLVADTCRDIVDAELGSDRLRVLVERLMRELRGPVRLAQYLATFVRENAHTSKGAYVMLASLKLRHEVEAASRPLPDSMEKMQAALTDEVIRIMTGEPERLVAFLKELGWKVSRPGEPGLASEA